MLRMLCLALLLGLYLEGTEGHGRLMEPPSRSSMWRQGYNTPKNYNDNQLFCGGFSYQWGVHNGKCGICGDPYGDPQPRKNEAGGKYAKGIITRNYKEGQEIEVDVQVTANHMGYFEFRVCPNNDITKIATQECLDKHVLQLADGSGTKYNITSAIGHFKVKLQLPKGLVCTQCVFQWKWHVGNSWGTNPDGRSCIGCGAQEEFYGCADVAIAGSSPAIVTPAPTKQVTTTPPTTPKPTSTTTTTTTTTAPTTTTTTTTTTPATTTTTSTTTSTTTTPTTASTTTPPPKPTTSQPKTQPSTTRPTNTPLPTILRAQTSTQKPMTGKQCVASTVYAQVSGMDWWCHINCAAGYCPASHCTCV